MRRFTRGLTSEHHPLYGTFCSKLSSSIFVWDPEDYALLREAKTGELKKQFRGVIPTKDQVSRAITTGELARHCRRRIRNVEEIRQLIGDLLSSMWEKTDTLGLPLINQGSMERVWKNQQKHLPCLQDPPGIELYTQKATMEKGGKVLPVLKCARGSSALESFHRHQNAFIPGEL